MANPLPEEKEFYQKIKEEKIELNPFTLDFLYQHIGDDITAINLLCQYYLTNQQPIPILEAKKILVYTKDIKNALKTITLIPNGTQPFPQSKEITSLHPIIRELIMHHIGNDVHAINLMVGFAIDPANPQPVSLEITEKILNHARMIREFLEKLREATTKI